MKKRVPNFTFASTTKTIIDKQEAMTTTYSPIQLGNNHYFRDNNNNNQNHKQ